MLTVCSATLTAPAAWLQVRELNSMLKAWEAMRLSKDAQIAALMERCKRYDEDVAEKARSNDALRRKLHHHALPPAPSSTSGHRSSAQPTTSAGSHAPHFRSQADAGHLLASAPAATAAPSVASSTISDAGGGGGGRARHIHLHMHPSLRGSAPTVSFEPPGTAAWQPSSARAAAGVGTAGEFAAALGPAPGGWSDVRRSGYEHRR